MQNLLTFLDYAENEHVPTASIFVFELVRTCEEKSAECFTVNMRYNGVEIDSKTYPVFLDWIMNRWFEGPTYSYDRLDEACQI